MNVKENQKFQSTHRAIQEALLELLNEKKIQQVTVSELCRRVGINRSTFYLHFLDVYDVLEKMAAAVAAEALVTAPPPVEKPPQREDFLQLLEHIRQHQDFYALYYRQGLPLDIQKRYFQREPAPPPAGLLKTLEADAAVQLAYHHAIFSAGLDAMLRRWVEHGCTESPVELYCILDREFRFGLEPELSKSEGEEPAEATFCGL